MNKRLLLAELDALKLKVKTSEAKVRSLESQLGSSCHFASKNLDRCSIDRHTGSAVILEITTLDNKLLLGPVAIRDGLSSEVIDAFRAELVRSYNSAIELKP